MANSRRKTKRNTAPVYLAVFDTNTDKPLGKLANVSYGGAMFVSDGPIKPLSKLQCRVEIPYSIMGHTEILFDVECRWCRRNVTQDRWESGFKVSVSGLDEHLFQLLCVDFDLSVWGDKSISDVQTVELSNRRKTARFELSNPLSVFEKSSYREIGKLVDLSVGGAGIISQKPMKKDEIFECRIMLPEKTFQQDFIILKFKCVRCKKLEESGAYETGHLVEAISAETAAIVTQLITYYAEMQHTEKRIVVVR